MCKAFVTPSLTRRLGLPLLPLSCLFLRASVQTYRMVLATHADTPVAASASSTQVSLSSVGSAAPSPAFAAALDRLDNLLRNALGRAVYGSDPYAPLNADLGFGAATSRLWSTLGGPWRWNSDDAVAALTMLVVFLIAFFALLVVKLVLGMVLLRYSRDRYARMMVREAALAAATSTVAAASASASCSTAATAGGSGEAAVAAARSVLDRERDALEARGKRVGPNAQVEIGEDRRRWIHLDDPDGLRKVRDRDRRAESGAGGP